MITKRCYANKSLRSYLQHTKKIGYLLFQFGMISNDGNLNLMQKPDICQFSP